MVKVSVVVPVYNSEKYLVQCLDSICGQTLREIEIICVDDGSTDQSSVILDDYAGQDERIKVIHKSNAGYGAAMNTGIDVAKGEYIGIVESDDCIEAQMYEMLYCAAVLDDLDVIKSDAYYWIEGAAYRKRIHYKWLDSYYDRVLDDISRNKFFDFYMNIWTGIYKRDFLNAFHIRFYESPGASYQDNGFWIQTLVYCRKAKWVNKAFYLYRQDNPEASIRNRGKMEAMSEEYENLAKVLCSRGDYNFLPYCYYYKLFRDKGTFFRIADELKREFCERIKKDYAYYKGYIRGDSHLEEWFRNMIEQPDEMCNEFLRKKEEMRNMLEKASGFIIYGAGIRGDTIFRILYNEGFYPQICCFAVTHDFPEDLEGGRQILRIEEANEKYPDATVIVAVIRGSGMYQQMIGKLEELEIDRFIDGTAMEEVFYSV